MFTLKELRLKAMELNIKDHAKMKKDELEAAVKACVVVDELQPEGNVVMDDPKVELNADADAIDLNEVDDSNPNTNVVGVVNVESITKTCEEQPTCEAKAKVAAPELTKKTDASASKKTGKRTKEATKNDNKSQGRGRGKKAILPEVPIYRGNCETLTSLDFKEQNADVQDALLHGPRVIYNGVVYNAYTYENGRNQHLFRSFLAEDESSMLLFTYVPKGRFGAVLVADSEIVIIKRIGEDMFELNFRIERRARMLVRKTPNAEIKHRNEVMDSFVLNPDRSMNRATHVFCPDPTVSRYAVYALKHFVAEDKEMMTDAAKNIQFKKFKCVEEPELYARLEVHPALHKVFWFTEYAK